MSTVITDFSEGFWYIFLQQKNNYGYHGIETATINIHNNNHSNHCFFFTLSTKQPRLTEQYFPPLNISKQLDEQSFSATTLFLDLYIIGATSFDSNILYLIWLAQNSGKSAKVFFVFKLSFIQMFPVRCKPRQSWDLVQGSSCWALLRIRTSSRSSEHPSCSQRCPFFSIYRFIVWFCRSHTVSLKHGVMLNAVLALISWFFGKITIEKKLPRHNFTQLLFPGAPEPFLGQIGPDFDPVWPMCAKHVLKKASADVI